MQGSGLRSIVRLGWPRAREPVHLDECPRDTIDRYARRLRFMHRSVLTVYRSRTAFDNEMPRTIYFRIDNWRRRKITLKINKE